MAVLVTGAAGFIGSAVAAALLHRGDTIHGIDNLSPYYDVRLKEARLTRLKADPKFNFTLLDIATRDKTAELFSSHKFEAVVHLAAQAGVRYSMENPHAYGDANLTGFVNILEGCRHAKVKHLVFASSSSVYGSNAKLPFSEDDNVDHPISLYAATKKANELMRTATFISTNFPARTSDSSPPTAPGAGQTWRSSSSRRASWRAKPSRCLTAAR